MLGESNVGPKASSDGTQIPLRGDKTGALVSTDAHARYQEAVLRGSVYTANAKSVTVTVTTDITPLPANTGRPQIGVYNPVGSGKNLVILRAGSATVSGTPGGPFYLDVIAATGTVITATPSTGIPINNFTLQALGSVTKCYAATAVTGSAAGVMLRPLGGLAAIAAGAGNYHFVEEIAGEIIVPPGAFICISAHATGTSHVHSCFISWEEVAI